MRGYRQHLSFRGGLWLHRRQGCPWSQLDENPSNQATISLCSPPKVAGGSELGNSVVLEVVQRCQGAEDALCAAELSGAPFAELGVAEQEGAGDLDTFSTGEEWF